MENRKVLVFPHVCLVGEVEKWESEKLFCLVREKCGRMENVVYMNWLLCEEMGKWRVGECNKSENICVIYYPHHLFFLVFLPNWEDKIMWARMNYFLHHFLSLLNQIRENFIFHLIFHLTCFKHNQIGPKINYFNNYEREDLNIGALIKMRKQYHKSVRLFWQISFCKKAIWQLIYKAINNYCCRILTIKFL